MRISLKKWVLFCVAGFFAVILTSCGHAQVKNDTLIDAAKSLVQGIITGDQQTIAKVSDPRSLTPKKIVDIADRRRLTSMKRNQFHFKKQGDSIVNVTFKDPKGIKDTWKLAFVKDDEGYHFFGPRSGSLVANSTKIQVAKLYMQGVIEQNPTLMAQASGQKCPNNCSWKIDQYNAYGVVGMKLNQFKFTNGSGPFVFIHFTDENGEKQKLRAWIDKKDDGYYYSTVLYKPRPPKINDTLLNASKHIMLGLIVGKPKYLAQLVDSSLPSGLSKQLVAAAKKHGMVHHMKVQQFHYQTDKDGQTVHVTFTDPHGKKVKWTLHFKQKNNHYFLIDSNILSNTKKSKSK